ncbi:MAG: acyl carrier protein [Myxococcales bacterium]|nr:MAG: acyl carrier protein [Myxococcales bacterium]
MLPEIQSVFRDVFDDDTIVVERQTTAADVEQWDSLMHVTLMVHIERKFGVRFSSSEVSKLKNVGELVDLVTHHVQQKERGGAP